MPGYSLAGWPECGSDGAPASKTIMQAEVSFCHPIDLAEPSYCPR
jgi:hypothetical protein